MSEKPNRTDGHSGQFQKPAWLETEAVTKIISLLNSAAPNQTYSDQARLVGGCVRNALLNLKSTDIDIATKLLPETVIALCQAHDIKCLPTGLAHGTVTAVLDGQPFEITTLRRDVATDGRHATVAFTDDWSEDAKRRDFTINALYADLSGRLYDYATGIADIRHGHIRFMGDPELRMQEDYLRLLRYFRFYALYGRMPLAPEVLALCQKNAQHLKTLSKERVTSEILKILRSDKADEVIKLMQQYDILSSIIPLRSDISMLSRVMTIERTYDLGGDAIRRLASIVTKEDSQMHLRLSKQEEQSLSAALRSELGVDVHMTLNDLKRALYWHGLLNVLNAYALALAKSSHPLNGKSDFFDAMMAWRKPQFPVRGEDLIARGLLPGEKLGQVMTALEEWWVHGDFEAGRSACLQKLDEMLA